MNETPTPPKAVYAAINAVQAALSKSGISKDRKNSAQNYAFRGIDDIYNALAELLAEHKLVILPRCVSRTVTERETKNGGMLFYVVVEVEFDFVSTADGSMHTIRTLGEAMDSGDKATNKAMSAAYKYAALMTFCIPTEADNDSENHTHEVAAKKAAPTKAAPPVDAKPITQETKAAILKLTEEPTRLAKLDDAMKLRNIATLNDLSEEVAQKILKWLPTA